MNSKNTLLLITGILIISFAQAQNVPTAFSKRDSAFFSQPYPYILPVLGTKVHEAKIRLPYPVGIMFNTLVGEQFLSLSDIALGFGKYSSTSEPNMIDLSEVIEFEDIRAQTSTFNLRVDTWLLPFVNVYGIVGQTKKADINVNLVEPFPLDVTTEVSGTYVGFGAMAAGAVGPVFVSLDVNRTYNYNPRLDDPAKVLIGGLRTGPVFRFKNNPEMNISLWTGAMYSHFNGETDGSIAALDLAPNAPAEIENKLNNLHEWYDGLKPVEQLLYKNIYEKLDNGLTELKEGVEDGYIRYSFNKKINNPWNMLIGAQWQLNYRWQLRAEAQFLGDRTAGLFSLNYRFGIRGKNWLSKK
ncbi:MAG: hypothetical protein KQI35_18600 [Bacteroidetes bacterium]|nr:hypothetical protein [Bacteroidota bacterium]